MGDLFQETDLLQKQISYSSIFSTAVADVIQVSTVADLVLEIQI